MSGTTAAFLGFGALMLLLALRAPIGLAMLLVGAFGYAQLSSFSALFNYMKTNTYHQFSNYTLSVIPLFILMGALAERGGIARALFEAAERGLGRLRGGLGMAVIGSCTAFGAICGSSVATTATFGRAALPELVRAGYDRGFAAGAVAVGGTLGILIPPSVILVVYAITTQQNIAKLFQAALIPGLLAAALYCVVIAVMVRLKPALAPAGPIELPPRRPRPRWQIALGAMLLAGGIAAWLVGLVLPPAAFASAALGALVLAVDRSVMAALVVAVVVVGGIYGGMFTPTEGAAVGAVAMLAVGVAQGALGWRETMDAIRQTAETSGMIFMILLGAEVFGAFLALSRLPTLAAETIGASGWSPYAVVIGILLFYIVLGAVMDELAMILLTLPVFFPIVQALDFGMFPDDAAIWFGILVLMVVGFGLTSPPVGLNVFVVSALARGTPITAIYGGVLPFLVADLARIALVLAFPGLALWLVRALS